jgi:8-oxo-dGTP pyrophosphatase MutT (NUDIX family)
MTTPLDRPSARVIVIDATGNVLLFRIEDPHDPKPPLWITPGGGIKPGEALGEAAARKLAEETGVVIVAQTAPWPGALPDPANGDRASTILRPSYGDTFGRTVSAFPKGRGPVKRAAKNDRDSVASSWWTT